MRDLDKALADILAIRTQIAAGTAFRGYGPAAMAITAALALAVTLLQYAVLDDPNAQPLPFFAYPFFAATLVGWAWVHYKAPVDNEARHGHLKSCRAPQPLSARARRWSAGMQGTRCASASPSMMLSDTRFVASL